MSSNWKCKWFGHKWIPVYIFKKGKKGFKFIGCYCDRCYFGHEELIWFVKDLKPEINSYNIDCWKDK